MTVDDMRTLAFTSFWSHALSPCGKFIVFGTNMCTLLLYRVSPDYVRSQFQTGPMQTIELDVGRGWLTLCVGKGFLFCGANENIWCFQWITGEDSMLKLVDRVPISSTLSTLNTTHITQMFFSPESDSLYVSTSCGRVHIFTCSSQLMHSLSIPAHQSTIHALSSAGVSQFATASEAGNVRFWDIRNPNSLHQPVCAFRPTTIDALTRPKLGDWLTTMSCDPTDWDWFVTGGGPLLSLWNRRACRYITPLIPDDSPECWYAQTSLFLSLNNEPRILAGGSFGRLYQWDHSGSLLASLSLLDPPRIRIGHVVVIDSIATGHCAADGTPSDDTESVGNCVLVVAGVGPAVRLVSMAGYPLGVLNVR